MVEWVDPVEETARRVWGVAGLYPIQRFVIANTLEGCGQIVVLPTGSGKSLCWQVPLASLPGPTLVVVPLLALLADQMRRLEAASVPAVVLKGGMAPRDREAALTALVSGEARVLFSTPEFLATAWARRRLPVLPLAHLVIDEAHCISEWGPSFRPAYLQLGEFVKRARPRVVSAFTATASRRVLRAIADALFADSPPRLVVADADRPGIFYRVVPSLHVPRDAARLLAGRAGAALVFGRTRREVERLARQLALRLAGREVRFYHAGLTREERAETEAWFLRQSAGVLVATSAYGLGVDKPDIRTVLHAGAPLSVEAYLQESGRAGRDGRPAEAILVQPLRRGAMLSPAGGPERAREEAILRYATAQKPACRRAHLLGLLGQPAPPCAGCDVCRGTVVAAPGGMRQILAHVIRHRRRYTLRETALLLAGRPRGRPALPGWTVDDILGAVASLAAVGIIRRTRGPLWRHRLTIGRACGPRTRRPRGTVAARLACLAWLFRFRRVIIFLEMRRTLRAAAGLAAGVLLGACGSSSLLNPDVEPEITIKSASNGQTVAASQPIVFAVTGGHSPEPDRVVVSIETADGARAGGTAVDAPDLNRDLSVDLAPLAGRVGQYSARFSLISGGTVIQEKSLVFFIGLAGTSINGIESRPSLIYTGSSVELSVELAAAAGADPFLRWTENGKPFGGGLASQGGARVSWKAPRDPGVYSIGVELFPVAPAEGLGFRYSSSTRTSTELYVSPLRQGRSLGPAASYWMLYDLDGSLSDAAQGGVSAEAIGTVEPAASGDNLGYSLIAPSGLRIARSIIPESGPQLQGLTVSIGLTLAETRPGARLVVSGADQRTITVSVASDGSPVALFHSESRDVTVHSGLAPLLSADRHEIDLTLMRTADGIAAIWFLDGEPGSVTQLGQDPPLPAPGTGQTSIGGPGGISGIVDEFGVFYRDADGRPGPDPDVYLRGMSLRYGDALLLADGFDGARIKTTWRVEGTASVDLGNLRLAPGSSVETGMQKPASGEIVLETVADRPLAAAWQGRTLRLTPAGSRGTEERTRLRLRPPEGEAGASGDYRFVLANGGDGPLSVASLLAYAD